MAIILDADIIIRAEKRKFDLESWIVRQPDESFEIAAITVAELWHGVERATGHIRNARERFLMEIANSLSVVSYTKEIALVHSRIWAELGARGRMIGYYDLIVAATALYQQSSVATFNVRHFSQVRGLHVIKPV